MSKWNAECSVTHQCQGDLNRCLRQVASTLSTTFYALFFLFSGFLQPASGIPPWWIWWVAIWKCAEKRMHKCAVALQPHILCQFICSLGKPYNLYEKRWSLSNVPMPCRAAVLALTQLKVHILSANACVSLQVVLHQSGGMGHTRFGRLAAGHCHR